MNALLYLNYTTQHKEYIQQAVLP